MAEALKIIGRCTLAAIFFGIAHDMVTAHVCVEYFSIGHPNIFGKTTGPAYVYALYWGFAATWWVGLPLGILIAMAARAGSFPKFTAKEVTPLMVKFLIVVWVLAMIVLYVTVSMGDRGPVGIYVPYHLRKPQTTDTFLAVGMTHSFSYFAGAVAGLILAFVVWVKRGNKRRENAPGPDVRMTP